MRRHQCIVEHAVHTFRSYKALRQSLDGDFQLRVIVRTSMQDRAVPKFLPLQSSKLLKHETIVRHSSLMMTAAP